MTLTLLTLLILFIAALIKATFGFGESVVAIPFLTLLWGLQVAVPLLALLATVITVLLLVRGWQRVAFKELGPLFVGAALGVPVGVWGLKRLPSEWLITVLGLMLILMGLYNLFRPSVVTLRQSAWGYLFGFVAGALGGAYTIASPPIIIYGAARRWSPEVFRFTLQGLFLPLGGIIALSHGQAGLWTEPVLHLFALSLPVIGLAFWLGNIISRRLTVQRFERFVYAGIILSGVMLLL